MEGSWGLSPKCYSLGMTRLIAKLALLLGANSRAARLDGSERVSSVFKLRWHVGADLNRVLGLAPSREKCESGAGHAQ